MTYNRIRTILTALCLLGITSVAHAAPAYWESNFGAILEMDGPGDAHCDDCEIDVTLSFNFPFDGINYTTVWVGTNGDLQLGSLGNDGEIDYDHWQYMDEFTADDAPSIAIHTDWDQSDETFGGTVHFNDFGDRAVFTWNETATHNHEEEPMATFQITLVDDGTIILGFNGMWDDEGQDPIDDTTEGIVIGITAGDHDPGTDPPQNDLNGGSFVGGTTVFERWCYQVADSCGFNGSDDGLPGPTNSSFDLDQQNVWFVPDSENTYLVSAEGTLPDGPGAGPDDLVPVPTLSTIGLGVMILLLVATYWRVTRRQA